MRIAFICPPGSQTFLFGIVRGLADRHDIRTCFSGDRLEAEQAIAWAELVWLEWAGELSIALTQDVPALAERRVLCRLHSYEAFNGSVGRMNWSVVDDLIFVAGHIREVVVAQAPEIQRVVRRLHVLPNAVDPDRFTFRQREPGFDLAFIGSVNYKKGPMLLLHALRELVQVDRRYRLSIAGEVQDLRFALYFNQMTQAMGLQENLSLDGWIDDVDGWLQDKQYVVCTSLLEGHPVGLMEAMAAGLKPVIHRYVGASGIFPEELLWNSIPQFVRMVTTGPIQSAAYRELICRRYSLGGQMRRLEGIINQA
ncbi:MAG: glycosyltransferase family 4 protein [Phycisphaerales bacterium]|nr:MAG: glycosyltransferase family 4 protein [Phycisphaerales bacterium]